ncbi:hypothetical protein ACEQ8H_003226 [Pleosporales sp. CAS-2024a]
MVLSKFDSLCVRPPTPPKDLPDQPQEVDAAIAHFLEDPFDEKPALPKSVAITKSLLNTPEQSPSSDISGPSSAASGQKRVNFELQLCGIPPKKAIAHSWTPTRSSPLRPLPQTRVSRPLKSILKPSDETATPPPHDQSAAAHSFKTFAEMLESIVKLLASSERPSRMDAYHALQRTMQAYDQMPDDQALKRKMSLLTQFIRRDVHAPSPTGAGLDSQLIGQSLKLLMALFRIPDAAGAMEDDFCAFVVDRSIQVAADSAMPKILVNSHLATLMQQNFRPKIMNNSRVERLMDVLDTVHERVGGFSVQAYRMRIFRKLIMQRPDMMAKHTERWFKHALKAFMANQKDINQSALDIALTAAKTLPNDRHVAKSCLAVLNRVRGDGDTVAKVFTKELERMLGGDHATLVPQIWSAVTVLLRDSIDSNMFFALKDWLELFQKCIASKKETVRVQTNVAFSFLIYAVNISTETSEGWINMFLRIPQLQLQRCLPARKEERDSVSSAYFTLLYYALRPDASHHQLDRFWRDFVLNFWTTLLHNPPGTAHATAACRTVSALLNGPRKPWHEQRALDQRPSLMIQRVELPLLDPKWVRRSLPAILPLVETLLDATPFSKKEEQEDEPVKTMWTALLASLTEASSKEIVASSETKDAMAHIVNLLRRVWDGHTAQLAVSQHDEDIWADKFCFLLENIVQKLGPLHFADKFLSRNESNDFEVASTPSHRSRPYGTRISPLLYFTDLLVNQSEGKLPDAVRLRALKLVLEPCFNAQKTRLGELELLRDCSLIVTRSTVTTVTSNFWTYVAAMLQASMQQQHSDAPEQGTPALGKEYDVVVDIIGLGSSYFLIKSRGLDVLEAFVETIRKEAGEAAVILAAVEKVSERMTKLEYIENSTTGLSYLTILLQKLPKQVTRRSLEQGRQNLWPASTAIGRQSDFDPYRHLYTAINSVGAAAYENLGIDKTDTTGRFLAAFATTIKDCTTSHLAVYLRKTQNVIRTWVEDTGRKMQTKAVPLKLLHSEVVNLWTEVVKALERLPRKDAQILLHLESLITAGFVSKRKSIVNMSIATWNKTFGQEESLQYPPGLEQALRRLRNTVELSLPSLESRDDATDGISFYESDSNTESTRQPFKSPRVRDSPYKISKSARKSSVQSPAVSTPGSRRSSARRIPKVRLRHDNSQIQFEPIVSSPSNPFVQESQVLTERQKEMIERQRISGSLFANMGAPSRMELHLDAMTSDDLTTGLSNTTPLKTLAATGSLDMFLDSSPTPHARKNTRQIVSDDNTSLATPTAVRTDKNENMDDLGSSPPRFEKDVVADEKQTNSDILVGSSFDYRQPETSYDMSFDEGTTIDEEALLDAAKHAEDEDRSESAAHSDVVMSDVPSSTIDLQIIAQLDADIQAQTAVTTESTDKPATESNNESGDAVPKAQTSVDERVQAGSDTEVDERDPTPPRRKKASRKRDTITSDTSRVGDSFSNKPYNDKGTPQSQSVRRSSRHSGTPSPLLSLGSKKRRSTPAKTGKQAKSTMREEPQTDTQEEPQEERTPSKAAVTAGVDSDGMLDNIVVANSLTKQLANSRKRKSTGDAHVVIPETHRTRGPALRSQSLLSQVENSQDVLVEDTPAPKRARQSTAQDVSEATSSQASAKRLSHVQVTPRRSSDALHGSSVAGSTPAQAPASTPAHVPTSTPAPLRTSTSQQAGPTATPSRSFTERVILTPRSIINQLKSLKDYLFSAPQLVIGREEEREIDDALFHIRRGVLVAGLRGEGSGEKSGEEK